MRYETTSRGMRTALYPEDASWPLASQALTDSASPLGRIDSKGLSV